MREKIIIVITLRPKTHPYLDDDSHDHKKAEGTKKSVIKQNLMFQNFKDCWSNNKNVYRSQQRFKIYNHDVYTEKVIKIPLSANDDKILQTYDNITAYPHGTNARKVCESEMLNSKRFILSNTYKEWSTLMIKLTKIKSNTLKSGHIFQIIHIEY